ncbi:MAG: hypothetical protein DIJKHBIC_02315 [Thermoanaerobaculia bacterium]|nr:hypothetical protein [Thermoanaerobaculia bacterium]
MRERLIRETLTKQMTATKAAELLDISRKQFHHLKARYERHGVDGILPKKPGPKPGWCRNRTPDDVQDAVCRIAALEPAKEPVGIAVALEEELGRHLHATTVWRILKRRKVRYTQGYCRWVAAPQLYCLEEPGQEVQFDACFPYGRSRQLVSFDCVDDCSRWADGELVESWGGDAAAAAALRKIVARCPFRIRRIRVDNGFGRVFREACAALGIEVVYNDAYSPEQNGKVERWHRTLKHECFSQCRPDMTFDELQYRYRLWMAHYNARRHHTGLGMDGRTPRQKLVDTLTTQIASTATSPGVTLSLQQYKDGLSSSLGVESIESNPDSYGRRKVCLQEVPPGIRPRDIRGRRGYVNSLGFKGHSVPVLWAFQPSTSHFF